MKAVEALSNFVNGAGLRDKEAFVYQLMLEYRTIQQEIFDLMIQAIIEWANMPEHRIDARNSGAVRLSKTIVEAINKPVDHPFIISIDSNESIEIGKRFAKTDGDQVEEWEFTQIDKIALKGKDNDKTIVVEGRARRIY